MCGESVFRRLGARTLKLRLGQHAREKDVKYSGDPLKRLDTRVLPPALEKAVEHTIDIAGLGDTPLKEFRLQAAAPYHGAEALH
jgi:hypothetical protein